MPKVKIKGKTKKFPYTKAGVKEAKAEASSEGGKLTYKKEKKVNRYGLSNLKK